VGRRLIKFEASWCGACEVMEPVFSTLATMYGIDLEHVDVDEDPATADAFGIRALPTLVLMREDGQEQARVSAARVYAALERDLGLNPMDRLGAKPAKSEVSQAGP
jgi:thiol-disulfide isomerase/thioredoxin